MYTSVRRAAGPLTRGGASSCCRSTARWCVRRPSAGWRLARAAGAAGAAVALPVAAASPGTRRSSPPRCAREILRGDPAGGLRELLRAPGRDARACRSTIPARSSTRTRPTTWRPPGARAGEELPTGRRCRSSLRGRAAEHVAHGGGRRGRGGLAAALNEREQRLCLPLVGGGGPAARRRARAAPARATPARTCSSGSATRASRPSCARTRLAPRGRRARRDAGGLPRRQARARRPHRRPGGALRLQPRALRGRSGAHEGARARLDEARRVLACTEATLGRRPRKRSRQAAAPPLQPAADLARMLRAAITPDADACTRPRVMPAPSPTAKRLVTGVCKLSSISGRAE